MPFNSSRWLVIGLVTAVSLAAQEIPVIERTLPNGMRVLMVERHDHPTIACGWVARVGSANERPGITGLAHLLEHMLFKGTKTIGTTNGPRDIELNVLQDKVQARIRAEVSLLREKQRRGEIADMNDPQARTPRLQELLREFDTLVAEQKQITVTDEFSKLYEKHGSSNLNAFTDLDMTVYTNEVPANKLELWMWLESDRLLNPVFREFYSERSVVLEERKQSLDATPTGAFEEAFAALVWAAHPYSWAETVIGWPSDISQVTREQASEFFTTYYAPNNLTAVLVGDFNPDQAMVLMERYFGRLQANPQGVPEVTTTEPPQVAEQRLYAEAETTPEVEIAYKTVASVHKDAPALSLLADVLNGKSGRLYKQLVLKQKVATSAKARVQGAKYSGTFALTGVASADHTPEDVEKAIGVELEKIQRDGISEEELQKVKNQSQAAAYARFEKNMGLMLQLAKAEGRGDHRDCLKGPLNIQKVTRWDVQRVAKQYFAKENRNVLIFNRKVNPGSANPEQASQPSHASLAFAQGIQILRARIQNPEAK